MTQGKLNGLKAKKEGQKNPISERTFDHESHTIIKDKNKFRRIETDRKILQNAKSLNFIEAIYQAFPDAGLEEEFGVTACGENLLVRRFSKRETG